VSRHGIATCVSARLSWWKKRHGGDDWTAEDCEKFIARTQEFLAESRERWAAIVERYGRRLLDAPQDVPLDDLGAAVRQLEWIRAHARDLAAAEVLRAEASDGNVIPFARRGGQLVDEGPRLPPTG
jgi:endo-alpha-1,4-polygalactosaminidase (GH114 family)